MTHAFMQSELSASALTYAGELARLTETQLTEKLPDQAAEGEPWFGYVHDARNLSLFLNLQLNRLASELGAAQQPSRSVAICSQHHRAYRDLTGALVGVTDPEYDLVPAVDEWPLRTVIGHITGTELGFSLLIDWAVERQLAGDERSIVMPREEMAPHYEDFPETGSRDDLMGRYAHLHQRVIDALMPLAAEQLEARNIWWEGYEVPVWFRMHRFDAHLREHTIQVDKTLAALDRAPTEAERLARLLHQSLADVEICLPAAGDDGHASAAALASDFDARREQLRELR